MSLILSRVIRALSPYTEVNEDNKKREPILLPLLYEHYFLTCLINRLLRYSDITLSCCY
ncbi:Conserved hypothetical protein [Clostridium acetobutylicum EA 2018]|uniref:Uncharacterized protein n=1 Tax=Clostridium acetobutylicum (strain ATCC 824 / DSM 792 / JCM 1419 / IAM 19013 / LMG 5710 / NBRC 13948 / NRRL B-527 / VKM B-1787 / 2291 / W) TaxID=272562 RepID=Q97FC8_CLOAB|nr:Hypothetical protein CA_C2812 [Clostridium acetobutylicum ATCC 824]ADZ21857.1 Conserved hypothetical protein [Clostridium acetobutylicum EA 2018]AEI32565.1 hypothetical protein SMB_G2848 [Clostridium acetobutylicum DSM 1731]